MKKILLKNFLGGFILAFGILLGYLAVDARDGVVSQPGDKLTSDKWNELVSQISGMQSQISSMSAIPAGSIVAFNLAACPSGWSEYSPAYGRFLRGIDKSGSSIDPSGQRSAGNVQTDAFQGHYHSASTDAKKDTAWQGLSQGGASVVQYFGAASVTVGAPTSDGADGTPRTANETRPKNVAVLYCVKN